MEPNDNLLEFTKFKAFVGDKVQVKLCFLSLIELKALLEKEKNADYHHFFLFPQCFQRPLFIRVIRNSKNKDCWYRINSLPDNSDF